MPRVITVRNVYTQQTFDVCQRHFNDRTESARIIGDVQVQHGLHGQGYNVCDVCDNLRRLDRSIAPMSRRTEWRYGDDA